MTHRAERSAELTEAILESNLAERKNRERLFLDESTGLPNDLLFHDRLREEILAARHFANGFCVVYLNLYYPDIQESETKDLRLEISNRLVKIMRKTDIISWAGKFELLILLNDINETVFMQDCAKRILNALSQPYRSCYRETIPTVDIGCAVFPVDGQTEDALIRNAMKVSAQVREYGPGSLLYCNRALRESNLEDLQLKNDLYQAVERCELVNYYQPQVDANSGEIIGLEALIRWIHPKMGVIGADRFIPVAESVGLISQIGNHVLQQACAQSQKWRADGFQNCTIAVNLSPMQLRNSDLLSEVEETLGKTGFPPELLELEITESIPIDCMDTVSLILQRFQNMGISIAIDDFGTAYSSFRYIKSMPINTIKIDKSFIEGIGKNFRDEVITRTIIAMGRELGLRIIAEGVETERQVDFLLKENCFLMQGYFFYKPMEVTQVQQFLKKNHQNRGTENHK